MRILSFLFLLVSLVTISCKNDGQKAAEAGDAAANTGQKFDVVPGETTIGWRGSKVAYGHSGTINVSQGEVYITDNKVTSGKFTIDMNSIIVEDLQGEDKTNLENHLKGTTAEDADHFFNTAKFPTGTFEITSITDLAGVENANATVKGNLTLKGVTKEITFPANINVAQTKLMVTSPIFTINRTDFGIAYQSKGLIGDIADKVIKDEFELALNLTANIAQAQNKFISHTVIN